MSYELGALHHPRERGRMYRAARPMPMRTGPIRQGRPTTWTFQPSSSPRSPFLGIRTHQYGAVHAAYGPAPSQDITPEAVELSPGLNGLAFVRKPRRRSSVYMTSRRRNFGGPATLERNDLSGLGFSLKPPKFIRKAASAVKRATTLKNVLKVGAVVAGAALVPGALPLIAKGALAVGRGALTIGGRGISAIRTTSRLLTRGGGGTPPIVAPQPSPAISPGDVQEAAAQPIQALPPGALEPAAPTVSPGAASGGTSYALPDETSEAAVTTTPKPGGGGAGLVLAGLAAVVLFAASKRHR